MSDSEGEDESWEEVEEKEEPFLPLCPFCSEPLPVANDPILSHCLKQHDLNLTELKTYYSEEFHCNDRVMVVIFLELDFYGWIKLVNYIRKKVKGKIINVRCIAGMVTLHYTALHVQVHIVIITCVCCI